MGSSFGSSSPRRPHEPNGSIRSGVGSIGHYGAMAEGGTRRDDGKVSGPAFQSILSRQLAPTIAAITKDLQTPAFASILSRQLAPTIAAITKDLQTAVAHAANGASMTWQSDGATVAECLGAVAEGLFGDAAVGVDLESLASEVDAAVTQAARDAGEDPASPSADVEPYRSAADRALIQVFTFLITSSLLMLVLYRVPGPEWTAAVQELWNALGIGAFPVGWKAGKVAGALYDKRVGPAPSSGGSDKTD